MSTCIWSKAAKFSQLRHAKAEVRYSCSPHSMGNTLRIPTTAQQFCELQNLVQYTISVDTHIPSYMLGAELQLGRFTNLQAIKVQLTHELTPTFLAKCTAMRR